MNARQASNFGPRASLKIVDSIRDEVRAGKIKTPGDIRQQLKAAIISVLQPPSSSELNLGGSKTSVILVIGVNGGGKTTTIGKLAYKLGSDGAKVHFYFKTVGVQARRPASILKAVLLWGLPPPPAGSVPCRD